jgi:ribonuclease D
MKDVEITHLPTLLQICAGDSVLLVQLFLVGEIPASLVGVLENEAIVKAGVGIDADAKKLKADWNVSVRGAVDLSRQMEILYAEPTYLSLAKLCARLLGVDMCKVKRIVTSNWEAPYLSCAQIVYAALDAWVGCECWHAMDAMRPLSVCE